VLRQSFETQYPFIIMIPRDYHPIIQYKHHNVIVKRVKPLDRDHGSVPRYSACINKLYVWTLTQYNRVCWLDSDMIVMKNIDHIMNVTGTFVAAPGCPCNALNNPRLYTSPERCTYRDKNQTYINSGLFCVTPCMDTFNRLLQEDYNQPLADQDVFNKFFEGSITLLPYTYNYMSHLPKAHPELDSSDVHVYHFTYDKPWEFKCIAGAIIVDFVQQYAHLRWWAHSRRLYWA